MLRRLWWWEWYLRSQLVRGSPTVTKYLPWKHGVGLCLDQLMYKWQLKAIQHQNTLQIMRGQVMEFIWPLVKRWILLVVCWNAIQYIFWYYSSWYVVIVVVWRIRPRHGDDRKSEQCGRRRQVRKRTVVDDTSNDCQVISHTRQQHTSRFVSKPTSQLLTDCVLHN